MFIIERSCEITKGGKTELVFVKIEEAHNEKSIIDFISDSMIDNEFPHEIKTWKNDENGYTYIDYGSSYDFFRYKEK